LRRKEQIEASIVSTFQGNSVLIDASETRLIFTGDHKMYAANRTNGQLATLLSLIATITMIALFGLSSNASADLLDEVEHGYADSDGVKIHYATVGEGPLVIMVHGFPDFWYTWRHQMEGLKDNFKVVAIDQRGYNLSGQPEDESDYNMRYLIADIAAVIHHLGEEKATIVGHD